MLGNQHISQSEFERVKEIYIQTGALTFARQQAKAHIQEAVASLWQHQDALTPQGYAFLLQLVKGLQDRSS